MLTREQKQQEYERLRGAIGDVSTLFLLSFRSLKVNEVNELRSKVRAVNGTYKVVKNSVVSLAVQGTPLEALSAYLSGPNALAFTREDPVVLGKVIRDFVKTHPGLAFERAYIEGQVVDAEQAQKIAELPGRTELIARLLFMLQSPIRRLAVALNSPVQKLTSAVNQIAEQKVS